MEPRFKSRKRPGPFDTSNPPPEGWMKLSDIAKKVGSSIEHVRYLAANFSFPYGIYRGVAYADPVQVETVLSYRDEKLVNLYYNRRPHLQRPVYHNPPPVPSLIDTFSFRHRKVYAPELIGVNITDMP